VPTFSGRAALHQAAILLDLSAEDVVLCTAYCCGHEVEPLLRRRVRLEFYDVGRELELDLDALAARVGPRTRAILVTHYFGFPQRLERLRALCSERGIALIEDCAHAFLSRDEGGFLGRTGDLAIFSMRKTIPIPHGGALLVQHPSAPGPSLVSPPAVATWVKISRMWKKSLLAGSASPGRWLAARLFLLLALPLSLLRRGVERMGVPGARDTLDGSFGYDSKVLRWVTSLAQRILDNFDLERVVERRRSNFQVLLEALGQSDRLRPLLGSLPEGVCPLNFPALVSSGGPGLVGRLQKRGIAASMWWTQFHPAVPWEDFPDSPSLKSHVVALPILQDLYESQMLRTIEELRSSLLGA
jgi:dTDP-4-amino-4,6-dideoxygalactose transaminase